MFQLFKNVETLGNFLAGVVGEKCKFLKKFQQVHTTTQNCPELLTEKFKFS